MTAFFVLAPNCTGNSAHPCGVAANLRLACLGPHRPSLSPHDLHAAFSVEESEPRNQSPRCHSSTYLALSLHIREPHLAPGGFAHTE